MCWEWDDGGKCRGSCLLFFKANTLSLWPCDISCATVGFEVCWGKSVFVSLDFICPARILKGCMQAFTEDCHYHITNYQCTKCRPNSILNLWNQLKNTLLPTEFLSLSFLSLSSPFCRMNDFVIRLLKDIMKSCLNNSIRHSIKIIIPFRCICT